MEKIKCREIKEVVVFSGPDRVVRTNQLLLTRNWKIIEIKKSGMVFVLGRIK